MSSKGSTTVHFSSLPCLTTREAELFQQNNKTNPNVNFHEEFCRTFMKVHRSSRQSCSALALDKAEKAMRFIVDASSEEELISCTCGSTIAKGQRPQMVYHNGSVIGGL